MSRHVLDKIKFGLFCVAVIVISLIMKMHEMKK